MAKKKNNPFKSVFTGIFKFVDKFIVTPISTLVYNIQQKIGKDSKIEKILNRPNMLIYLSLIFAIILFAFIDSDANSYVNTDAEIIPNQKIKVKYNSSAYVVEDLPETVDITLIGKKGQIYLAKRLGDNEVLLDLSDYEASDTPVRVKLTYNKTINSLDYKLDPSYVTVTIKKKISSIKTVSYDLLNQDKLDSKLSVKNVELSKSEVVVKGAEDTLNKIATVKALINLDNSDFTQAGTYDIDNISLVAYDISGNIVKNVEIVATNITAKIELNSYSKRVPVNVLTTGKLVSGKAISSIKINDVNISDYLLTIYGEESVIDSIESVPVTIDISGQGNNGSKSYNVTISKPSGVRSISEPKATINLNFGEAKQKSITIKGIKTRNVPSGLVANLESADDSNVEVQVVGVEEVINSIDPNSSGIEAYVDLTGYAAGTYSVSIEIKGNDSRLQYIVTKKVNVVLSNQSTN